MNKKKTIYLIVFSAVVLITAFVVYMFIEANDDLEMLKTINITDVDLSNIDDGDYYGEYKATLVSVKLEVTVSNHQITNIRLIEHDNLKGKPAEAIIDDVINEQSLNVDSIAGATYSSRVILLAIEDALEG